MMSKLEPKEIKNHLESYAKNLDIKGVKNFISTHKDEIYDIYNEYGSGNEYLRSAYDDTCSTYHKFALAYQIHLEKEIAGDVLFLDE